MTTTRMPLMNTYHLTKVTKNYPLLLALFPLLLAFASQPAFAHSGATGSSRTSNVTLNNGSWRNILSIPVLLSNHTHYCTVVGSADARHVSGNTGNHQYTFGLSLDGAVPAAGVTRTVELNNNPGVDDPNVIEIGSTAFFTVPAGVHTFRWRARRSNGNGSAVVDDASMTINCFKKRLGFIILPPIPVPPVIENPAQ
ncbi:hypothetical protein Noc_0969 [Nitrosococcus oceani ATCC 19707]|uniref:Uncharacterized protein n=2 Tax=Nitrosococcus oceani TaxID=1229 RepID=Q3JCG7_NITOC|nr:hypothetical protein Noc_0969 [Nitrosococcus oceani ATCC 19707]